MSREVSVGTNLQKAKIEEMPVAEMTSDDGGKVQPDERKKEVKRARIYTADKRYQKDCTFFSAIYFYQQLQGSGEVGCGEEWEEACVGIRSSV